MADVRKRYNYEGLEPMYVDIAKRDLKENPKMVLAHIESLRKWLSQSKHIKNCPDDDEFLLRFLRAAKFDHEKAQCRLENLCTLRGSTELGFPHLFNFPSLDDVKLQKYLDAGFQLPCGRNSKGELVMLVIVRNWDPDQLSYAEWSPFLFMTFEILTSDELSQIAGVTFVFDLDGLTKKHMDSAFANQTQVKNNMRTWQDGYPMRNRNIYYYKEPVIFDIMFNLMKFWMKPKLVNRLYRVKNDLSKIHAKLPDAKKVLPKEYGGENGTVDELKAKWKARFTDYWSKPHALKDLTVDESLRPKDTLKFLKTYDDYPEDIFGTKGTFTKISAD